MQELTKLRDVLEAATKEIKAVLSEKSMEKIKGAQIAVASKSLQEIQADVELAKKELQMLKNTTTAIREAQEAEHRVRESAIKKLESETRESVARLKSEAQELLADAQKMAGENKKKQELLDSKLQTLKSLAS